MSTLKPADPARQFERYRHEVYAWAFRLLGTHHDALDVAQDVFLRWAGQVKKSAPEHPRSWLRRVTINRAIDLGRSERGRAIAGRIEAATAVQRSPAERDELRTAISDAMADLTDMQRSVLTAKVHEGLTFAQIAAEHDLAVPTVKTHYLRALRAVRDRLQRGWDDRSDTP